MVTTKLAVGAIVRSIGFDPPRVAAVARRLTEAGTLPAGAPKTPPQIDVQHVVALILGCAIDAPLRAVADRVNTYLALVPGGANLDGAPVSIPRTAGEALAVFADMALSDDAHMVRRDIVEVVSNFAEIAIHDGTSGRVSRFVPVGETAAHWQASGHRNAVAINGARLVGCLRELFTENKR